MKNLHQEKEKLIKLLETFNSYEIKMLRAKEFGKFDNYNRYDDVRTDIIDKIFALAKKLDLQLNKSINQGIVKYSL